ncbi:MAG: hypothetical protein R3D71_08320 [Rickettsiales bacterium]
MLEQKKHKQAGHNIFMSSMQGLADTLAAIATFIGTGPMHNALNDFVKGYAASNYGGESAAELASLALWPACFLVIFFGARATIGTALIFGAIALLTRFA